MAYKENEYRAGLTREQFLFYETRTTAKLMSEGYGDTEIIERIQQENLFQYPTEKMVAGMAKVCIRRIKCMESPELVQALAVQPSNVAKQICLYAMMKENRVVREFMLSVIGEKYRLKDFSFGKIDVNVFFLRLQEQNSKAASWSETTVNKMKQVLTKVLVETEYLDNIKADHINPVLLESVLDNTIRSKGEHYLLPAFNCFS